MRRPLALSPSRPLALSALVAASAASIGAVTFLWMPANSVPTMSLTTTPVTQTVTDGQASLKDATIAPQPVQVVYAHPPKVDQGNSD